MAAENRTTPATIALLLLLLFIVATAEAHNITAILADFPEYTIYNKYLSDTRVADEINTRLTITVLVLPDPAMAALTSNNHTLPAIKNALRLLTLLDYFDAAKLHSIPSGTTLSTSLLQTTGLFPGNEGFVNITDLGGGRVGFGPSAPGSRLPAEFSKSIKEQPYNISVLEITSPILFPGLLDDPTNGTTGSDVNITSVLEKAGCKEFAGLLVSSGVLKTFQDAMGQGLTVLAPNDGAFKVKWAPKLKSLTKADLAALLLYHSLPSYSPKESLKAVGNRRLQTLASGGGDKFELTVTANGDDVSLATGVDTGRVASTALDASPLCVLTLDSILLPVELFGKKGAPAGAPGPAPVVSPSPVPAPAPAYAPAPGPKANAPSPVSYSPPAPPANTPGGLPADGPVADGPAGDGEPKNSAAVVGPLGGMAAGYAAYWVVALVLLGNV